MRTHKRYSREVKERSVRMVLFGNRGVQSVAARKYIAAGPASRGPTPPRGWNILSLLTHLLFGRFLALGHCLP